MCHDLIDALRLFANINFTDSYFTMPILLRVRIAICLFILVRIKYLVEAIRLMVTFIVVTFFHIYF